MRPSTYKLVHGQPLTTRFGSGIQRFHYSSQAQALAFEDTTETDTNTRVLGTNHDESTMSKIKRKKNRGNRSQQNSAGKVQPKNNKKCSIDPVKTKKSVKKPKIVTIEKCHIAMANALEEGNLNKAIKCFREIEKNGLKPDVSSYTMIINGYSQQSDMIRARKWLGRMQQNGIEPDAFVYTSLIDGYMREANVDTAEAMFKLMMQKDIKPTLVTYNILMHHSARQLNMESALKFWGNLLQAGLKSDVYTYAIILHGLSDAERVDEAWRVFKTMQEENVDVNEIVATTLMGMHVKQHDNEYALKIFNTFFNPQSSDPSKKALKMTDHTRNVLLNAIISKADVATITKYYNQYKATLNDEKRKASSLFVGANVYTYTSFMRAFLRRDDLDMVRQVFNDMTARNIKPTLVTYATLMLAHAFKPDPESCNRMLIELKKGGVELNAVLYTIVMRAWAKAGKWEQVKQTYESMKQDNIQPTKVTMEVLRYARPLSP